MRQNLVALLVGVGFGFVLVAARLNEFDTIHRMLLLQEPDVFLLMGSAIATAAPILLWLRHIHWQTPTGGELRVEQASVGKHNVLGAMVFGTGWAITGACPGPAIAMTATGTVLGLPLMAGLMTGAVLRDVVARPTVPSTVLAEPAQA